jgi:molybdate transport system regulatory protein
MKMSYRQAWGNIKKAENRLGFSLLIKKVGGEAGGGAQLTPAAVDLVRRYALFRNEAESAIGKVFIKYFP